MLTNTSNDRNMNLSISGEEGEREGESEFKGATLDDIVKL